MKHRVYIAVICSFLVGIICFSLITFRRNRSKSLYEKIPVVTSTGEIFIPCSINDHGQIAGLVPRSENRYEVIIWDQNTKGREVVCLSDYMFINPIRINNSCQVTGGLKDANGVYKAFLFC